MRLRYSNIAKTFTFRLALVYVGMFSLSIIILFGFIYSYAMRYVREQISDSVRTQYTYLAREYSKSGSKGLEARIKELVEEDNNGSEIYILVNRDNKKLGGNLDRWPDEAIVEKPFDKGNWVSFYIESAPYKQKNIKVKAVTVPLSKWRKILVGKTLQDTEKIEYIIAQTFWASLLVTMIMAFIGAMVITRSVMRRINVINRSTYTIMHGALSTRIPFTKGGDEFDGLSYNLNNMLDRIEGLLKSLSEFANNIAHDLRSPLNRIIGRLENGLRKIDEGNPARELLEKNIYDIQELIATFNAILKISELEANREFHDFKSCNLQVVIGNMVEFYEPYALDKNIEIINKIDSEIIINGERKLLEQAFANLIDNAIKFTPEGGMIEIYYERKDSYVDIIIADNGIGIPKDSRDKVFEKFFRLEQSRNTRGNGLGLSMVATVASIHNIEIIFSDNNPGLKVCMRFNKV
ncbi:MAG: HAMP domain-containing sensor histidine kinase [Rickettsiales bacterium]